MILFFFILMAQLLYIWEFQISESFKFTCMLSPFVHHQNPVFATRGRLLYYWLGNRSRLAPWVVLKYLKSQHGINCIAQLVDSNFEKFFFDRNFLLAMKTWICDSLQIYYCRLNSAPGFWIYRKNIFINIPSGLMFYFKKVYVRRFMKHSCILLKSIVLLKIFVLKSIV